MNKGRIKRAADLREKTKKFLPNPPSRVVFSSEITPEEWEQEKAEFKKLTEGKEYAWQPMIWLVDFVSPKTKKTLWKGDKEWDAIDNAAVITPKLTAAEVKQ